MAIPGVTLIPGVPVDASPGDVVYRIGQVIEVNGVTRTVATDAVVSGERRLDIHFEPDGDWIFLGGGQVDLSPSLRSGS